MFAICLDFPYEHQIKKIYNDIIYKVSTKIEMLAKENGCTHFMTDEARFYFFDDECLASTFFVIRFLHLASLTLEQVSSKIHEWRIIVDFFTKEQSYESAVEELLSCKDSTLLYNRICIGNKASRLFKKYLSYSTVKTNGISVVEKFSFFGKMKQTNESISTKAVPIYIRAGQSYMMALSNFILMTQFSASELQQFSEAEKRTYNESRSTISFFEKNRFKEKMEKYFVDAFILHAQLHAKMYKKIRTLSLIDVYVDKSDKSLEAEKVKQIIGSVNIVEIKQQNVNIDSIPDDLLELIYVLLYSIRFIFVDEASAFFFATTKSIAYEAVLSLMYQVGVLSQEGIIHSYKEQALKQIEKKFKLKKASLNIYIAKFLLGKYKNAELCADIHLKSILDALRCDYDKILERNLIVDIFFNTRGNYLHSPCNTSLNEVSFQSVEVLKKYESALSLDEHGQSESALALSKDLNTYFHNSRLLSGEYKSFAFLSFLYLKNNNINDAQTYCVYALELAKKTKNNDFVCEAMYFLGLVYFLKKDFSNALEILQELVGVISASVLQEWKVHCLLLQGRIYLELGRATRATSLFKLAQDLASRYFTSLLSSCNVWYGRACLYDGNFDLAVKIFQEEKNKEAFLFLLEAVLLFSEVSFSLDWKPEMLKYECEDSYFSWNKDSSVVYNVFEYMEDIAWKRIYKMSYANRLFKCFYSYYKIRIAPDCDSSEKIEHLASLKDMALESLYAKDANASLYLYLCYDGQCAIDGKITGVALGFLSKACSVLQRACTLLYTTEMRDAFMKENPWNAKLFRSASENKLL